MPRSKRIEYPGACYHVMARGNNGQDIFLSDDGRRLFLSSMEQVYQQTGWRIHAYVLMSNHYHLLLETPEANLVAGMKWLQGTYTQRFNAMFQRKGHLFQGRYKAIPITTDPRDGGLEYFRNVSTYIHLNPFRAGLCGEGLPEKLESYPWSSYPLYLDLRKRVPEFLEREKVLYSWGLVSGNGSSYREKLERHMRFEVDPAAGRRGEFDDQMKRGWYIGTERFADELAQHLLQYPRQADDLRGQQRRTHGKAEAEQLIQQALALLELRETDLIKMKKSAEPKQAIAWLLMEYTTATGQWIAERLHMGHRTNCSHAISKFRASNDEAIQSMKEKIQQLTA